jgi:hypothetical protein
MNLKSKAAGRNPAVSEHIDVSTSTICSSKSLQDYSTLSSPYFLCAMIGGAAC